MSNMECPVGNNFLSVSTIFEQNIMLLHKVSKPNFAPSIFGQLLISNLSEKVAHFQFHTFDQKFQRNF